MGAAELRVYDFDGFVLDPLATGTCEGNFLVDFDIASQFSLEAVKADAPGDFPAFVRGDPMDKVIPLHIMVREGATTSETLARINEMKEVFSPFKDPAYLRVVDTDSNLRRMLVKSLGVVPWEGHSDRAYVASLDADEPIWESDALSNESPIISGSAATGYSFGVTNAGNVRTYPTMQLWPLTSKGHASDYVRKAAVQIAWRSPFQGVDTQGLPYPIDITDGEWDTAALVSAGHLRTGCDDVRVFVDEVEVDRYIERPNTTGTSVWCSIPFAPARSATVVAMTAVSPAAGEDLLTTNPDGTLGFPDVGVLLIDNEAVYYRGRTADRFQNILRAWEGTTAAIHGAGSTAWLVEHQVHILYDCLVPDPLERADRKPIIDLPASTNTLHVYGTTHGLIDPDTLRTGQWLRELRSTDLAAVATALYQNTSQWGVVTFRNPIADYHNYDTFSLYTPCLPSGGDLITLDYLVAQQGSLSAFEVDAAGYESRSLYADARCGVWAGGSYIVGPPQFELADTIGTSLNGMVRLSLMARNEVLTGYLLTAGATDFFQATTPSTQNREAQSFTLAQDSWVTGVSFLAGKTAGADRGLQCCIVAFDQSTGPGVALTPTITIPTANIPASPADPAMMTVFFDGTIRLPAGKYAILWICVGGTAGSINLYGKATAPFYSSGERWDEVASVWTEQPEDDIAFLVLGHDAPTQVDAEIDAGGLGTWSICYVRDISIAMDNGGVTPKIVMGSESDLYFWQATLENVTTGQALSIYAPGRLAGIAEVFVDTAEHVAQGSAWQGSAPRISRPSYIEPDDLEEWLRLDPGVNQIRYTEPNIGNGKVTVAISWRDRWT